MNRLFNILHSNKIHNRKILSLFLTAGYPIPDITVPLVIALAKAGADIIELGIPFSDPIADGPIIQHSSTIALQKGVSVENVFVMAKQIRNQSNVPVLLMGYANSIYSFGVEKFLKRCSAAGVDGTIIADLPPEESEEYKMAAEVNDIATVFFASPTTPPERLKLLDRFSNGFLYFISVTGVTGTQKPGTDHSMDFLAEARKYVTKNPILVGFGISGREDAKKTVKHADGVIIGSALVQLLKNSAENQYITGAVEFTKTMRKAIDQLQT